MDGGEPACGDPVGRFRLEANLGSGAVGLVFRARDEQTGALVAVKVLRPELARDPVYTQRFLREARIAASVEHECLVKIVDAGVSDGIRYLAVDYVPGRTLRQRLDDEGPMSARELARLGRHLGGALHALHTSGLVHRDVKPENVLLDEGGRAHLTDYGLARGPAMTVLTRKGQLLGTPAYLAPELVEGGEGTPASDVYSLGCVLYECIAGRPPFVGRLFEVVLGHVQREPPDPLAGRPDLPASLGGVVLSALAKEPAARPPTGRTLAQLLRVAI
jgi:serine/threonine-protein kinase